jgi:hypothetical protein
MHNVIQHCVVTTINALLLNPWNIQILMKQLLFTNFGDQVKGLNVDIVGLCQHKQQVWFSKKSIIIKFNNII